MARAACLMIADGGGVLVSEMGIVAERFVPALGTNSVIW